MFCTHIDIQTAVIALIVFGAFGSVAMSQESKLEKYQRVTPQFVWSTYLGGSELDTCLDVACDASGNIYAVGYTGSSNWIDGGIGQEYGGGTYDGFVAKYSQSGELLWFTYLGGSTRDQVKSIAIDSEGNLVVAGFTQSKDWIPNDGFQAGFVSKLSGNGNIIWLHSIGGEIDDMCFGVAITSTDQIVLVGATASSDWIGDGPDATLDGGLDGFIVKLTSDGSMVWARYLGGNYWDEAYAVAISRNDEIVVAGETSSTDWCSGGWDSQYNGSGPYPKDGFVVKLTANGAEEWSSYIGGNRNDVVSDIAIDSSGAFYLVGTTFSDGWVSDGWDTTLGDYLSGFGDSYLVKLNSNGSHIWSTFVGGGTWDEGHSVAVDAANNVMLLGNTSSVTWMDNDWDVSGPCDVFLAKFLPLGDLDNFVLLGGSLSDFGYSICANPDGQVTIAGETDSPGWLSSSYSGLGDGFLLSIPNFADTVGSMRILLEPSTVSGAAWRRVGTNTWYESGFREEIIPKGIYEIEFKEVPGWLAPARLSVSVTGNQTTVIFASYTRANSDNTLKLVLSPVASPQHVNSDIPFTLRVENEAGILQSDFTGRVYLGATGGVGLSRAYVDLTGGTWSGTVTIDSASETVTIQGYCESIIGESNVFSVDSAVASTGFVSGTVFLEESPLSDPVTLQLRRGGSVYSEVISDSQGEYLISSVPPGGYEITLPPGAAYWLDSPVYITVRAGAHEDRRIQLHASASVKPVVLLVPGIMGTTWGSGRKVGTPYLPKTRRKKLGADKMELVNPLGLVWDDLRQNLKQTHTVINVPYDWRMPIEEAAREYFVPAMRRAISESGDARVSVVAHSMGGLIVRSYIQGFAGVAYENDIEMLALVGSPAGGGPIAYYLWDGGDTANANREAGPIMDLTGFAYGDVINLQIRSILGRPVSSAYSNTATTPAILYSASSLTQMEVRNFIRDEAPSLGQLMYAQPFLVQANMDTGAFQHPMYNQTSRNQQLLWKLASDSNRSNLFCSGANSDPANRIPTRLFYSTKKKTLSQIKVSPGASFWTGVYEYGSPVDRVHTNSGDGTVPSVSASYGLIGASDSGESFAYADSVQGGDTSHAFLMDGYVDQIAEFIGGDPARQLSQSPTTSGSRDAVSNSLSLRFLGRTQPFVADPAGGQLGIDPASGNSVSTIEKGSFFSDDILSSLEIETAKLGEYDVQVLGVAGEVVDSSVSYAYGDQVESTTFQFMGNGDWYGFDVILADNPESAMDVVSPVAPPVNLRAQNINSLVQLAWDAPDDSRVTGYRVYGRQAGYTWFSVLSEPTNPTYSPGHAWVAPDSADAWEYAVVSLNAAVAESFIGGFAANSESVSAQFTADMTLGAVPLSVQFTDQSAGELDTWMWDFDADGTIDSRDQNASTTYTDPGWYTVHLTVSSPHGVDTAIKTQYIQVTPSSAWGTLNVQHAPFDPTLDGAGWSVDGGTTWHSSGEEVMLPAASYTVAFKPVDGWVTPALLPVTVLDGSAVSEVGTYTSLTGGVLVSLEPGAAVVAGAQWHLGDNILRGSGEGVSGLTPGNYTVQYMPVSGWLAPESAIVTVEAGEIVELTGMYVIPGGIRVSIEPELARIEEAQWCVDGGAWHNSGETESNLAPGTHTVSFKAIPRWNSPSNFTTVIVSNQTTQETGVYAPKVGSLNVTISPAGAISAGAKWRVDGGTPQDSGATVSGLPIGDHTVSFDAIANWDAPTNKTVTISEETTTNDSGAYVRHTGSLTVTLNPPGAIAAGAQWQVDGGPLQNSGATVTGLPVGSHTVSFTTIADWAKPGNINTTISHNATTSESGTYTRDTGSLTVTLSPPEAVTAGAGWQVDGGDWHATGDTVSGLATGNHVVTFRGVDHWVEPTALNVSITRDTTTNESGAYIEAGSIITTIEPMDAVTAGAQWKVDGGAWQNSGARLSNLAPGSHTVQFKSVSNWTTPPDQTVTVTAREDEPVTGIYVQHIGSILVNISPAEAVSAGAQWKLDNEATFRNSGTTATGVPVGNHAVSFKSVDGWVTPTVQLATVAKDQTSTHGGTYARTTIARPTNLQASDGTFTDKVRLTWTDVAGATNYKIFRASTWNGGEAATIGTTSGTTYDDFTALPPQSTGGSGGGCKAATPAEKAGEVYYVYWVQALDSGGIQSDWSEPNDGYRGSTAKLEDWLDTPQPMVYERALPTALLEDGTRAAKLDDTLALRLRADDAIDPTSLDVTIEGVPADEVIVEWMPINNQDNDGWAIVRHNGEWPVGTVISITAEATSEGDDAIQSDAITFTVVPQDSVLPEPTPMDNALGETYTTEATGPFATPVEIRIPVPTGHDPSTLALYYYLPDGEDPGWHPVGNVQGLLYDEPVLATGEWVLHLNHGGMLSIAPTMDDRKAASPAGLSGSVTLGSLCALVLTGVALLLAARRAKFDE
ncbi:MAG: hypothetical protein AMXMBFR84_16800 [Candidatus Hydrogenedentota bacterium]